jgi:hemerythrin
MMPQHAPLCERSLGVPSLDAAHQAILDELDRLSQVDDKDFCNGYCELARRIDLDFSAEEKWMEKIIYPQFQSHLEQHSRVLSAIHHAMPRVMEGDIASGRKVIRLLPQWFMMHIPTMDRSLATALRAAGVVADSN